MILRDLDFLLHGERRFDHRGDEAGGDVPLDMAVEEPDTWIIGAEAHHDVAARWDHEGVAPHGHCRESFVADVVACVFGGADDGLEGVPVEMERVFA